MTKSSYDVLERGGPIVVEQGTSPADPRNEGGLKRPCPNSSVRPTSYEPAEVYVGG